MKMKKTFYSKNNLILISLVSAICCISVFTLVGAITMQFLVFLLLEPTSIGDFIVFIIRLIPEIICAMIMYIISRFLFSLRPPAVLHRMAILRNSETPKKDVSTTGD